MIFAVKNAGEGPAINLVAEISSPDIVRGIVFPSKIALGTIPPNKQDTFEIPLTGNEDIGTGEVTLDVKVKEANFNDMKPFSIKFHSLAFTPPSIILADYKFVMENAGKALPGKEIILKVKIQNVGHGSAKNLKAVFIVPPLVNENDRPDYDKEELKPNETWEITFPFTPKYSYTDSILHIVLKLSESYGQYAKAENNLILEMNKDIPPDNIKVGTKPPEPVIDTASYTSDVDKDIPVLQTKNANRFALIIGNEDYSSYQKGIDKESDVEFAIQDARIFKTYCSNVMGIPDRNITLLINATTGTFNHEIEILSRIINTTNGQAEVFFYYAGHGFPDESTGEAYLVPVDVTGSNIKNGIRLNDLYSKLAEYPSQRITVFLDACFSGGGRNKSLEASRAVRINPKDAELKGNMVVFTSSSGNETSAPYNEKNHGIFTYFLLKKIKETNGDISYKDLYDYLSKTIKQESLLINKKEQNPSILHSPSVDKNWGLWNLKP
ncbi:MAG: Caspase domain protein [Bacteroidetes bacterium ADurb.Bin408]|nr:MAG: Caspase domain protein [Bacteroidetes bacterium ADurb.Bin408]